MRSHTRIFIFRLKQLITAAVIIAVIAIAVIFWLSHSENKEEDAASTTISAYVAGVYTSSITLNNQSVDIQVVVDQDRIKSAAIVNLEESVAAMYPLLETSMESISSQLAAGTALEDVTCSTSSQYTCQVLLAAISQALEKAQ